MVNAAVLLDGWFEPFALMQHIQHLTIRPKSASVLRKASNDGLHLIFNPYRMETQLPSYSPAVTNLYICAMQEVSVTVFVSSGYMSMFVSVLEPFLLDYELCVGGTRQSNDKKDPSKYDNHDTHTTTLDQSQELYREPLKTSSKQNKYIYAISSLPRGIRFVSNNNAIITHL